MRATELDTAHERQDIALEWFSGSERWRDRSATPRVVAAHRQLWRRSAEEFALAIAPLKTVSNSCNSQVLLCASFAKRSEKVFIAGTALALVRGRTGGSPQKQGKARRPPLLSNRFKKENIYATSTKQGDSNQRFTKRRNRHGTT